jgi:DNA-binding ferritin-like protein
MMTTLKMDNDRYIMQLRAGIVLADEAGEPAVGNFLQDLLGAHQKKAWMLRSITK